MGNTFPPVDLTNHQREIAETWRAEQAKAAGQQETTHVPLRAPGEMRRGDVIGQAVGASQDAWRHRSTDLQCRTCMWFVEKIGNTHKLGRCRRHAPTMSGYPAVFAVDWCGDHKLDENKV